MQKATTEWRKPAGSGDPAYNEGPGNANAGSRDRDYNW